MLERAEKPVPACRNIGERLRAGSEMLVRIGQIRALADQPDWEITLAPTLADAGIEHGRLPAGIRADEKERISSFDFPPGRH